MLGITSVHTNRTLQQLRKQGCVEFTGGVVTISDLDALKQAAEFNPAYLYLDRHGRGSTGQYSAAVKVPV